MSRSICRPNFEKTYPPHGHQYCGGGKIAGYYTEYDLVYHPNGLLRVFREPTKEERYDRYRYAHGEKTPHLMLNISKDERKIEEKSHRRYEKLKITKFLKGELEDVIARDKPLISPSWWW